MRKMSWLQQRNNSIIKKQKRQRERARTSECEGEQVSVRENKWERVRMSVHWGERERERERVRDVILQSHFETHCLCPTLTHLHPLMNWARIKTWTATNFQAFTKTTFIVKLWWFSNFKFPARLSQTAVSSLSWNFGYFWLRKVRLNYYFSF